jgi:hypothetical protein
LKAQTRRGTGSAIEISKSPPRTEKKMIQNTGREPTPSVPGRAMPYCGAPMFRLAPLAALAVAAGCESFPTPAQLDHATVLAVIADPPIVAPGAQSGLTVYVADHTGLITPPTTWSVVSTFPNVPPMGTVTGGQAGTAQYTAPDPIPMLPPNVPPVDSVQVQIASEPPITAVKLVGVQAGVPSANPTISDVTVGGASAITSAAMVAIGSMTEVKVTTEPAPDEHWTYAWYATFGEIKAYQSNPTMIDAGDVAADGQIFVVVRDGRGGAAMRAIAVTVR